MNKEILFEIAKWVAIVFVAGFIGYFGKFLGKIIISKFSKKESGEITVIQRNESPAKYKAKIEKQRLKLEKKRLKNLEKKL